VVTPRRENIAAFLWRLSSVQTALAAAVLITSPARGQTETIRVDLKLRTGGALSGLVVDHTDHGLVIAAETTPYVFAWDEIEAGSAYVARRNLLVHDRGGRQNLTAGDHFQLGLFTLKSDRNDLAAREFRKAEELDSTYKQRVREAFNHYREAKRESDLGVDPAEEAIGSPPAANAAEKGLVEEIDAQLFEGISAGEPVGTNPEIRRRALEVYKTFGTRVREEIAKDLTLIETDHFLIWTDWKGHDKQRLVDWCESMYSALCEQYGFDPSGSVFLAKCPVFCWQSKARFLRFAQRFDGHDGKNAIGYTRSIEKNGHVHMVLLRNGRSQADFDRFASTLVHEGTHAFLHRLYTTRLIPHWVNEGLADLVAERVLGDRCPNAENAGLLATQYVRYDWPIGDLLYNTGPIGVHQYPLAHSIVAYLESLGTERFAIFVKSLKNGESVSRALAVAFDGLTPGELEAHWRAAVRDQAARAGAEDAQ